NPHSHGTHTETLGHISPEAHPVNRALLKYFFLSKLISVRPETRDEDLVITKSQIEKEINSTGIEAIIIRTLPNSNNKLSKNYSNTNPPYLDNQAAEFLRENGIKHLLIDLPSVDKEKDEGALQAHKAFWNYPENPRYDATITEFIYVPDSITDGDYLLNLQIAAFENDAAPSRPILYKIIA
ncbi:MAG: cyclase family protein, partial [Flavobacteriaceae bacterium]|nr:cyclase family protein [Flavobacteriaceae bacterium]